MADVETRQPFVRGLPNSQVLEAAIKRAVPLGQELDADMELTILGRRPVIDDSPPPSETPIPEPGQEPTDPDAPAPAIPDPTLLLAQLVTLVTQLLDNLFAKPGAPRSVVDRESTTSADFQEVVNWTIPADRIGQLDEVSMTSDTPATALWRLTIAGIVQWSDVLIQDPLNIKFPANNELEGDDEVLLEVRSDGAIAIVADGSISGIEREP